MKTTYIGKNAEQAVANYLKSNKYEILCQNWRTRVCEIDVIAKKDGVIYFVEVKYRGRDNQGDGLAYITPKKLRQMNFAAEIWIQENGWEGDWRLLAAAVDSQNYKLTDILEVS